jgi:hypothetical protein
VNVAVRATLPVDAPGPKLLTAGLRRSGEGRRVFFASSANSAIFAVKTFCTDLLSDELTSLTRTISVTAEQGQR